MDVDFGGSDITVIADVLNWEECGGQSFKNIIIMIINIARIANAVQVTI